MNPSLRRVAGRATITLAVVIAVLAGVVTWVWLVRTDYYVLSAHPQPVTPPPVTQWSAHIEGSGGINPNAVEISANPAVGKDGTIYVAAGGGVMSGTWRGRMVTNFSTVTLTAFDSAGKKMWEFMPGGDKEWDGPTAAPFVSTAPAIADDGTILVATANGDVFALNPDGSTKWEYQTQPASMPSSMGWVHAPPAIAVDGTSYWPGKVLTAISPSGSPRWRFTPEPNFYGVSIGRDGTIYARTATTLYALHSDGTQVWKVALPAALCQDCIPALDAEGSIYVTARGTLLAIRPDGTLRWERRGTPHDDAYEGTPLIGADGTAYVAYGPSLAAVASDGKLKWKFSSWHEPENTPSALGADGTIYVAGTRFRALSHDGRLQWQFTGQSAPGQLPWFQPVDASQFLSAAVLTGQGRLYVGDHGQLVERDVRPGLATGAWPMPAHDARNTARAF